MSGWLISFIVSGAGIVLFILLKLIQEHFSILLFWPDSRQNVELRLINQQKRAAAYFSRHWTRNFYIVVHFFVAVLKNILSHLHIRLDKKSHRLVSLIRGKQHVEPRNTSSYFLNDIASFRNRFRKK